MNALIAFHSVCYVLFRLKRVSLKVKKIIRKDILSHKLMNDE